uniref:Uncharacterized protein n=1 Tax=Anguilla anguilla TaxID=7936 RepID=A0A0E9W3M8_ANGAN
MVKLDGRGVEKSADTRLPPRGCCCVCEVSATQSLVFIAVRTHIQTSFFPEK